jgi:hypothetical protein
LIWLENMCVDISQKRKDKLSGIDQHAVEDGISTRRQKDRTGCAEYDMELSLSDKLFLLLDILQGLKNSDPLRLSIFTWCVRVHYARVPDEYAKLDGEADVLLSRFDAIVVKG